MALTKVTTRLEIDLTALLEECHLEIEVEVDSYKIMDKITDRIIEGDHKTIIGITLGEEITGRHKPIEVRIIEVDVETITEMYRDNYRDDYRNDKKRQKWA